MSIKVFFNFRGAQPVVAPKLLGDQFAQEAVNTLLTSGNLRPYNASSLVTTVGKQAGPINTVYRLTGSTWLHWQEVVNVARIPIENNSLNRIAFTGTDVPRVTDELLSISGGGNNYPEVSYALGVPAPNKILNVSRYIEPPDGVQLTWDIAGTASDSIGDRVARVYTYTFVNQFGEEGPPADPSQIAYTNDDECVDLDNFASAPTGPYLIERVRIYRSLVGATGDPVYLLVDDVPFAGLTTYRDCKSDAQLGAALDSTTWSPPPDDLQGITAMANGMLAGFKGNTLYFSEPYQVHGWPEDYIRSVDYDIVGLSSSGNILFIMTEGYPYIAVGNHPEVMSLNRLEKSQACVSSRSIADIGQGAVYASADGLVAITAGGTSLITEGVFDKRSWKYVNPSTLHGYFYKGKYFAFYDASGVTPPSPSIPAAGGFIFDPQNRDVTFLTQEATAAFFDEVTGSLYYMTATPNELYLWDDTDAPALTMRWKSKEVEYKRVNFAAARVSALTYPVTFRLYVDNVVAMTKVVANKRPFRLPSGFTSRDWAVEVEGTTEVEGVFFAVAMEDLW